MKWNSLNRIDPRELSWLSKQPLAHPVRISQCYMCFFEGLTSILRVCVAWFGVGRLKGKLMWGLSDDNLEFDLVSVCRWDSEDERSFKLRCIVILSDAIWRCLIRFAFRLYRLIHRHEAEVAACAPLQICPPAKQARKTKTCWTFYMNSVRRNLQKKK